MRIKKAQNGDRITIPQADARVLNVDIIENAFVSDFALRNQANQASNVQISSDIGLRSLCRHDYQSLYHN